MTQTQSAPPAPASEDDTGPIIALRRQGLSTREIAERVHLSQSTVQRRLRQISPVRLAPYWQRTMYMVLIACAVISTAALACMAWR
jgi:DNA invertase Pin-like site-specific DNA recombinase